MPIDYSILSCRCYHGFHQFIAGTGDAGIQREGSIVNRPVIYTDFDGVLNAFPDDKIQRRGGVGHTGWLKPDDPRAILYSEDRAFPLTGNLVVNVPVGHFRIHWSRELANAIHALAVDGIAEVSWLTTWQPYCDRILDPALGWDYTIEHTIQWYDPVTREGRLTGKFEQISSRVHFENQQDDPSPLVWLDDEECHDTARARLEEFSPAASVLMIRPDEHIGVSRRQWKLIQDFIAHPGAYPSVTLDEEPTIRSHSGHFGL